MNFDDFHNIYKNVCLPRDAKTTHATQLLAWYIRPSRGIKNVLEIGSGSGYISIYLAKKFPYLNIHGIEIDREETKLFETGTKMNNLSNVSIINNDILCEDFLKKMDKYDMIVSNPPHYIEPGILGKNKKRITERSFTKSEFEKFICSIKKVLKNKGVFYLVIHPRDSIYWFSELLKNNLGIHRMRFVHGKSEKQAQLILIKGVKNSNSNVVVEPAIFLESGDNSVRNV